MAPPLKYHCAPGGLLGQWDVAQGLQAALVPVPEESHPLADVPLEPPEDPRDAQGVPEGRQDLFRVRLGRDGVQLHEPEKLELVRGEKLRGPGRGPWIIGRGHAEGAEFLGERRAG